MCIEFESLDSLVCLSADMWTSIQQLGKKKIQQVGNMCIAAHYVDANFNVKKKIISFKKVKCWHIIAAI